LGDCKVGEEDEEEKEIEDRMAKIFEELSDSIYRIVIDWQLIFVLLV